MEAGLIWKKKTLVCVFLASDLDLLRLTPENIGTSLYEWPEVAWVTMRSLEGDERDVKQ